MSRAIFENTAPQDYLTRLAASDLGQSYKALAVGELGVQTGDTVLDLGCGPGSDLATFARAAGTFGSVIGIDNDPAAVEQARARTSANKTVDVRTADVHTLALADHSIHRVYADRVLQHVADPAAVLHEAYRVLRPTGRAVFAEPDWDTLIIDYPDLAVPGHYRRFIIDQVVRNGCIGRQLPRLAGSSGFTATRIVPITTVFRDATAADTVLGFQRVTERAVAAGYLSRRQSDDWLDHLSTRPFFASVTLFIVTVSPRHYLAAYGSDTPTRPRASDAS